MPDPSPDPSDVAGPALPLLRRLERLAPLAHEEKQLLGGAWKHARTLDRGEDLVREGDSPTACSLVLDGYLCRYKLLPEGKRQITAFLIAGDLCELDGVLVGRMDHAVCALTPATVAALPRPALEELLSRHPGAARALWQASVVEAAIAREWVANVGQRSALQRVAHLLCEMRVRLQAAGLSGGDVYAWPVTQAEMADATGISVVHVNRVLQQLRRDGLIALAGREVTILDWQELQRAGGFTSGYLCLGAAGGAARAA